MLALAGVVWLAIRDRRRQRAAPPLGPARLEELAEALIAAAEEALDSVEQRRQALEELAQRLEQRLQETAAPAPPPVRSTEPPPAPSRFAELYALADSGLDLTDIARRAGLSRGEVQLILGLRAMH